MKKINQWIINIFFCSISFGLNAQNFEWANKGGAIEGDPLITVDAMGNSYVCGRFDDSCRFGAISLISAGNKDIFLCKYNSLGFIQWAQRAGGIASDAASGICSDASGNIYVTGQVSGTADFGSTIISGNGGFIAKYASTGTLIWVKNISSLPGVYGGLIAAGDSGKLFIAGGIGAPSNFGCANINTVTPNLKFIAGYDTSGAWSMWRNQMKQSTGNIR